MPDREDSVVDSVQATRRETVIDGAFAHAKRPQLLQRHQPMLRESNLGDLNIPMAPPTGRNPCVGRGFRPVGGGLGGHGATVAGPGALVVR